MDLLVPEGEESIAIRWGELGKYGSKHEAWQQEKQLKAHVSTRKQEATNTNSKMAQVFETSKSDPNDAPLPARTHHLILPIQPANGNRVYKCLRLNGGGGGFTFLHSKYHKYWIKTKV